MMEIYNENMEPVDNPDLSRGRLVKSKRIVHHDAIDAVEEQWHYEVSKTYPNGGRDLVRVVDVQGVEGRPAWDEEIQILIYQPYTAEEIEAIEQEKAKPTIEEQVAELYAALEMILTGVTE